MKATMEMKSEIVVPPLPLSVLFSSYIVLRRCFLLSPAYVFMFPRLESYIIRYGTISYRT